MWKKNNTDYSFFLLFHYLGKCMIVPTALYFWIWNVSPHQGNTESRKYLEQNFQLSTLMSSLNRWMLLILLIYSYVRITTFPPMAYIAPLHPTHSTRKLSLYSKGTKLKKNSKSPFGGWQVQKCSRQVVQ